MRYVSRHSKALENLQGFCDKPRQRPIMSVMLTSPALATVFEQSRVKTLDIQPGLCSKVQRSLAGFAMALDIQPGSVIGDEVA
jgi:hypothetical protein